MKALNMIKPAILLLIATSFHTLTVNAQETKNIAISNFSGVSVSAGITLILTQGSTEGAKVVANEESINEIVIEKNGSTATVKWKEYKGFFGGGPKNKSAKVYITYKKLNAIQASSGSSVTTENILKTDRLDIRVSSGASASVKVTATDLQLQVSSGATASLNGTATNMVLQASSGSSVKAVDLVTENASVRTSSGATVTVNANKTLQTNSNSGSSIGYKGNAEIEVQSKSKGTDVRRIS